jgi:FkbM family methyltransferase
MTHEIETAETAEPALKPKLLGDGRGAPPRQTWPHPGRRAVVSAAVGLLARRQRGVDPEVLGLAQLVGPGSVCVDVGAAAGLYTAALSDLAGPTGQVHSVEPLRFVHPVVTRLLAVEHRPNVWQYHVALGAESGVGTMSVPIGPYGLVTGRSFLARPAGGLGSNSEFAGQIEVVVPVDTLDALCDRAGLSRLDFLKIDVEGAELAVLQGGTEAVESFRPTILLEIEARHIARYPHSAQDTADWLIRRGYTMHTWQRDWCRTATVCDHTHNYLFRPEPRS